ncbi:MAG: menaquinone biosynthesis decarboxylase, partial [Nitrospirota bacterium]
MAYRDLSDFIRALEKEGELVRVKAEVDPILEITEIADRQMKSPGGGKALLFENVKGSPVPVIINAFGSTRRMNLALEVDRIEDVGDEILAFIEPELPKTLVAKIKMLPRLKQLADFIPKTVKTGPCKDVIETTAPSLDPLPVLQCWPEDAGRFITFPLVFTRNPRTGRRNCGMYRMQVYDSRTTGMHWQIHKHGAKHYQDSERAGRRIDVAVAIGTDPAVTFAAMAPMPDDVDEMMFAGFLRKEPVEMVKCETVDLEVPANSEIVLEGYCDPEERRVEGPFGDHTGYYSLADSYPVFHVTAVTRRKNPIYSTTIVGRPPMEDYYMGKAVERIFLPLVKKTIPEIVDM